MIIYVAHPLGRRRNLPKEEIEENVLKSIALGKQIMLRGHFPLVPNLYWYMHSGWTDSPPESEWLENFKLVVARCDAFFYGGQSEGCDAERAVAEKAGIPIYTKVEDIPGDGVPSTYNPINESLNEIRHTLESLVGETIKITIAEMLDSEKE